MMDPSQPLESILQSIPALFEWLDSEDGLSIVDASGQWILDSEGIVRHHDAPLPAQACKRLVEAVAQSGPRSYTDRWWLRPVTDTFPPSVVIQRRPSAEPDGLSPHTLELLRSKLPPAANGIIFGRESRARTDLLASLTQFLPADLVIYVGAVPPVERDSSSVLYVAPPRDDRDRRKLMPVFERASAVLYDGPVTTGDVGLLYAGTDVEHRWATVDATRPQNWLTNAVGERFATRVVDTRLGVDSSPGEAMQICHFSAADDGQWNVFLDRDGDAPDGTSRDDPRLSDQLTTPIDHRSGPRPSDDDTTLPRPGSSSSDGDSDIDVDSLMEQHEEPGRIRESGEIDVPGFVSRFADDSSTQADESDSDPALDLHGERIDDDVASLVASEDIDSVDIPELEPEQLRQTYEGPVDAQTLDEQSSASSPDPEPPSGIDSSTSTASPSSSDDPPTEPIGLDDPDDPSTDEISNPPEDDASTRQRRRPKPNRSTTRQSRDGSSRSLRRTSQLGAETSGAETSPSTSTRSRRRSDHSTQRVLPVPRSSRKNDGAGSSRQHTSTETTTTDLSPVDTDDEHDQPSEDTDTGDGDTPPPVEIGASDSDDSTIELDVDDELQSLRDESSSAVNDGN